MTEANNEVQLEGQQLEYARQARQAIAENVATLREIVFNAIGVAVPTDQKAKFAVRLSNDPEDCIDLQDENGNCVGMYCDPPGICKPCPVLLP
jgi:hypothetical protein